nr:ORF5 protein [Armillaria gallica negative stranded RNA virus 1]
MSDLSAITDYQETARVLLQRLRDSAPRSYTVGYPDLDVTVADDPTRLSLPALRLWTLRDGYYIRGGVQIAAARIENIDLAEQTMAIENQQDLTIYLSAIHCHGRWSKYVRYVRRALNKLCTAGLLINSVNRSIGAREASRSEISEMTMPSESNNLSVLSQLIICCNTLKDLLLRTVDQVARITPV